MSFKIPTTALVLAGALWLGGCVAVPRGAGFDAVAQTVAARTGHLVQWRGQTADDTAVDAAVRSLLRKDLTPDTAVQIALLNNRSLQATFEDLGIAEADLVQAGLLKNPVFAGSWRFPDRSPRGTNVEYAVTEDFLDLMVLPLRKQVAQQEFERTKLLIAHQVLQLAADVKVAFYTLQAREQLIDRLRVIADMDQTAAELARRQHEAGTLNELGMVNQEAIYHQSKVGVAQAEAQRAADRERLNQLLGLWGGQTTWTLANRLPPLPKREAPIEHLESLAMRQRLDLAATRAQIVTLGQATGITDAYRYFANIDVGLDTEREPDGQHVTGPTLELQLPIFDQGQARVAKVQAQFRQLQRRLEAMAIDARSEVRAARDRMVAQRALAEYYQLLLPERLRILTLTLQQYNGMLKGTYDLLLARQSEVNTERAYIEAWRDYWISRAELERAVGGRLPSEPASSSTAPSPAMTLPTAATTQPIDHDAGIGAHDHSMHERTGESP